MAVAKTRAELSCTEGERQGKTSVVKAALGADGYGILLSRGPKRQTVHSYVMIDDQ